MFTKKITTTLIAGSLMALGACSSVSEDEVTSEGIYYVESSFSTPRGVPEIDAPELETFLALGENPNLVGGWLLELIQDEIGGIGEDAIELARNGANADQELTEFLLEEAPEMVEGLVQVSSDMREVLSTLNLSSEIILTETFEDVNNDFRLTGSASHEVIGVVYKVGGQEFPYDLNEIGASSMGVAVTDFRVHNDNVISFGSQAWPVEYGKVMSYGIQNVVVEANNPFSDSLDELIASYVPCHRVGDWMDEEVGGLNDELYGAACAAAIREAVEKFIPTELPDISATLRVATGDADILEQDGDTRYDAFTNGLWEGDIAFPSTIVRLRRPNNVFNGRRSDARRSNDDDVFF